MYDFLMHGLIYMKFLQTEDIKLPRNNKPKQNHNGFYLCNVFHVTFFSYVAQTKTLDQIYKPLLVMPFFLAKSSFEYSSSSMNLFHNQCCFHTLSVISSIGMFFVSGTKNHTKIDMISTQPAKNKKIPNLK